jgi:hypothetical protein
LQSQNKSGCKRKKNRKSQNDLVEHLKNHDALAKAT